MKKKDYVWLIGLGLIIIHAIVIAEDVQAVMEDSNTANKPGEVLKLAFDFTRYFG
jgi:hypothetical protein